MAAADDIEAIRRQEAVLAFDRFDEAAAFEIGAAIRARALKENLPIIVDILKKEAAELSRRINPFDPTLRSPARSLHPLP